ncbi:hypothetical protein DNK08_07960 [Stutzerimonas kirkiae]|nr:hypothetical protein DNK08_07960 [Stutzerimonas kirkiae]TBV13496.1 hypothetical protein DNK01_11790 [Stutzerimonas kirkiae]
MRTQMDATKQPNDFPPLPGATADDMPGTAEAFDPVWETALNWQLNLCRAPADSALREELQQWLQADPSHAEAYRRASRTCALMDQARAAAGRQPTPLSVSPFGAVAGRVPPRHRRHQGRVLLGGLAACLALLWLGWPASPPQLQEYRSQVGEIRQVLLDDGSLLHLDTDTHLSVNLQPGSRDLVLHGGRAFFEVSPDRRRPFRVEVGELQVLVTGTAFQTSLTSQQAQIDLQSGSLQVSVAGRQVPPLEPGEQLSLQRQSGQLSRQTRPPQQMGSWRQHQLLAEDQPLDQVIRELARYYPGRVELASPALASRRVTGLYDLRTPLASLRSAIGPHDGTLQELPDGQLRITLD